jgi:glycosyltransferase involved in cell wall biosynthesis
MHILYVTHAYKPAYRVGGPIWSVSAAAEGLAARGHKVTVFTSNTNLDQILDVPVNQPLMVDGVEVWYFSQKKANTWIPRTKYFSQSIGFLVTPALRPAMMRLLPTVDVVHTQNPFVYPTIVAGRLAIKGNTPLFYSQRGVFHPSRLRFRALKKRLFIELFEKPIMRGAAGLIALSPEEHDSFRALGVQTRCHIIPNGIDVGAFKTLPSEGFASSFGIRPSDQVILFLGRLHPIKGVDLLIDAFVRIASEHPMARLVVAGPDEFGFADKLRAEIAALNLSERIILPGMVSGDAKLDLLARADLFVLPSMGEGLSMAVLEALASATPVIISPECNMQIVEDVGAGAVIVREPAQFAKAISDLLSDPLRLEAARKSAYALARDHFGWSSIVDKLEAVYKSALIGT